MSSVYGMPEISKKCFRDLNNEEKISIKYF